MLIFHLLSNKKQELYAPEKVPVAGLWGHMAIHALSLIKNEADIIEYSLGAAVRWCDHIYVFDNGSTDGTWEKVQAMAKEFPAIVAWKQDPKPFRDGLRAEIFCNFRRRARLGDWWCISMPTRSTSTIHLSFWLRFQTATVRYGRSSTAMLSPTRMRRNMLAIPKVMRKCPRPNA